MLNACDLIICCVAIGANVQRVVYSTYVKRINQLPYSLVSFDVSLCVLFDLLLLAIDQLIEERREERVNRWIIEGKEAFLVEEWDGKGNGMDYE